MHYLKTRSGQLSGVVVLLMIIGAGLITAAPWQDRQSALDRFEKIYHEILNRYVTEVDAEKLIEAGIEGMLEELDPYTQFIQESNSHRIDALTNGAYGGVGIRLGRMGDSLVVISPMDGTPAQRQGIYAGDVILWIDSVKTRDMTLRDAAQAMRGQAGTEVTLIIRRHGVDSDMHFELQREMIKVPDISYSGLIEPGVGYIKLANFSKYSSENLERALRKLQATDLEALVLDLRGNPGGLLSAALLSADLFIEKGEVLLETRGRTARSNREFLSRRDEVLAADIRMMVLVDKGSASASEILAGVLQDYDRAVIIGRDTFGKGLVQSVLTIDNEARLKLTTAKYYLPSGRLIQRHDFGDELRLEALLEPDSLDYYSANRRHLAGGGGISPDLEVDAYSSTSFEKDLWRTGLFFKYALEYNENNPGLNLPVEVDSVILDDFRTWLLMRPDMPPSDLERYLSGLNDHIDGSTSFADSLLDVQERLQRLSSAMWLEQFDEDAARLCRALEMEISNVLGGRGARQAASLKGDPDIDMSLDLLRENDRLDSILLNPDQTAAY